MNNDLTKLVTIKWVKSVVIEPGRDSVAGTFEEMEYGKAAVFIGLGAAILSTTVSTPLDARLEEHSTSPSTSLGDRLDGQLGNPSTALGNQAEKKSKSKFRK